MNPRIQQYFLDIIEDRRQGRKARAIAGILSGLAKVYGALVQSRLLLYRAGILRRKTLGCMIVSVGNLTVGGTGKTPVVEMLARSLSRGGRRVAILSRGYMRKPHFNLWRWWEQKFHYHPLIVSDGQKVFAGSKEAGDEPFMLAKNLPGVAVLVDKNRVKAGSYAVETMGVDTLILDDGFQYLPLGRRVDIVLVDAARPFGNGQLLPRGILREPLKNLKRATMVFLTKVDGVDTSSAMETIRQCHVEVPVVECRHEPRHLEEIPTGSVKPTGLLRGKRIAVLTAIACPDSFEKALRDLGADIALTVRYPDHHRVTERELNEVIKEAGRKKIDAVITTEKDAVRFPGLQKKSIPLYFLRVEIQIRAGARDFNDCVARLCNL